MKPERRLLVTPLTLEVVREAAHLEQIKGEWTRFAAGAERITPFQLPEWQLTWWRHFGEGRVHVMLFRSLDTLVAIVPCYLSDEQGRATLKLIGSGMAGSAEPPILARQKTEVAALLKGHLLANNFWQVCDWRGLETNSPLAGLQLGDRFELKNTPDGGWSDLPIQGSFAQYWQSRSFSLRRNFLKYLDDSSVGDRPRFEVVAQADPEFVNAVIRVASQEDAGFAQAKDGAAAFFVDLTSVLDKADMLRLFGLRYKGKLVAAMLALVHRDAIYAFADGHDPEFAALGLGRLLLFEALKHAFQHGYKTWNFLRGNEPYKLLWGARMTATARVTIERRVSAP